MEFKVRCTCFSQYDIIIQRGKIEVNDCSQAFKGKHSINFIFFLLIYMSILIILILYAI